MMKNQKDVSKLKAISNNRYKKWVEVEKNVTKTYGTKKWQPEKDSLFIWYCNYNEKPSFLFVFDLPTANGNFVDVLKQQQCQLAVCNIKVLVRPM